MSPFAWWAQPSNDAVKKLFAIVFGPSFLYVASGGTMCLHTQPTPPHHGSSLNWLHPDRFQFLARSYLGAVTFSDKLDTMLVFRTFPFTFEFLQRSLASFVKSIAIRTIAFRTIRIAYTLIEYLYCFVFGSSVMKKSYRVFFHAHMDFVWIIKTRKTKMLSTLGREKPTGGQWNVREPLRSRASVFLCSSQIARNPALYFSWYSWTCSATKRFETLGTSNMRAIFSNTLHATHTDT